MFRGSGKYASQNYFFNSLQDCTTYINHSNYIIPHSKTPIIAKVLFKNPLSWRLLYRIELRKLFLEFQHVQHIYYKCRLRLFLIQEDLAAEMPASVDPIA